ncbi:MAG: hypothetical protein AAGH89_17225 [Verrucomicrobiota bacterium]
MSTSNQSFPEPSNPFEAWITTIVVGLIVAGPELLEIRNGSHEPGFLLGQATMKLIAAFVIGALLVCRFRPFHFWLNWTALALGIVFIFVIK